MQSVRARLAPPDPAQETRSGRSPARSALLAAAGLALTLLQAPMARASEATDLRVTESMLAVRAGDIVLGTADAPVTMVTYAEFNADSIACGWDKRWRELLSKYPSKLRLVIRDFPMPYHQGADLAAAAAHGIFERSGEPALLDFVDKLCKRPSFPLTVEGISAAAAEIGAGPAETLATALRGKVWESRVTAGLNDVRSAKMMGSPTSFVNGALFAPNGGFDEIDSAIDQELRAAEALRRSGVSGAKISAERTRAALDQVERTRAKKAATEYAVLTEDLKLVPGAAIGPFYIGQTYPEVQRLGFHLSSGAVPGRVCVAGNAGFKHGYCTFTLYLKNNAVTQIDLHLDRSNANLSWNGKSFPAAVPFLTLLRALPACQPPFPHEGGRIAQCQKGMSLFSGTGEDCADLVDKRPMSPPCGGSRNILRLTVAAENPAP